MATPIRAILFDTFGTTVDWQGSLTATATQLGAERKIAADWAGLVKEWRAHYAPAIKPVREGKRPWTGFAQLHREELDKIVKRFGAAKLNDADRDTLTFGWSFLQPWPDVVPALLRLKSRYILGPLSNGTVRQMVDLARYGNLPWDVVFGADLFRTYKPDPQIYQGAAKLLELRTDQILLVAAHNNDLQAAKQQGLQTCFVYRRTEDPKATADYTYTVSDFEELARTLEGI